MTTETPEILLGKRCQSEVWSIPGGEKDAGEKGFWSTAARETEEEFCGYCLKSDDDQTLSTQGKTYFYPYGSSQNHTQCRIHYEYLFGFLYPCHHEVI
jgi:8-oxo-dGTP pyrophosphatase MutT (NUDIX family)